MSSTGGFIKNVYPYTIRGFIFLSLDKLFFWKILGHGGCYDRARATLLYAKCLIADSSKLENEARGKVVIKCAHMLEKVKEQFRRVEAFYRVKDVLFLQVNKGGFTLYCLWFHLIVYLL